METADKKPFRSGLTVDHALILIILSGWALLTQVKDAISGWALRNQQIESTRLAVENLQKKNDETLKYLDGVLTSIETKLNKLDAQDTSHSRDMEILRGDLKASRDRAYEAEGGLQNNITRINQLIDAKTASQVQTDGVIKDAADRMIKALQALSSLVPPVKDKADN